MVQEDLNKEILMAVVEYKDHVFHGDHRRLIPGFISNGGQWQNPKNHTFVGWVKENADFYVPWATLKALSKEDFVQRALQIHAENPISLPIDRMNPAREMKVLTEQEVIEHAQEWYDNYVSYCTEHH
jgi:hypothetical protein